MIELLAVFGGSFTLALSGALMPGPLFTITISESVRQGFKAGPLLMTGHAILEFALVLAVIQGVGAYLQLPPVVGSIALLGGLLLIYFGVDMVRTAGSLSLEADSAGVRAKACRNPVILGILTSLSNPYWTIWWATIGLGYLVASMKFGWAGISAFFLGHIAADFAWYSMISLGVSKGKTLLRQRTYHTLIRACGVLLVAFGGWFLLVASNHVRSLLS